MPAKSKAQQRLFGMVHAYQKGELDNPSKTIKKIGDNISFKKAKKFASTKHKKLPEKVDESSIKQYIPDAVYIVCDGTSCYGCFGCDIEDEIRDNEVEVVKGPFAQWNDRVDELIEKMNDKMYEGKMATTRLTESQLKKIVVESVKRVLNELDWKTYANAAGKLYQKAKDGFYKYDTPNGEIPWDSEHGKLFQRAEKFQSMANDRLRKDYGEPNYKTNPKGSEEFMHFVNGDYKYSGKKGWHLKDK